MKGRGWHFYDFIGTGHSRFMCSWETTEEDIEELVHDFREEVERYQASGWCRKIIQYFLWKLLSALYTLYIIADVSLPDDSICVLEGKRYFYKGRYYGPD